MREFDLRPDSSHSTCISQLLKGSYRWQVRSGAVGQKQPSALAAFSLRNQQTSMDRITKMRSDPLAWWHSEFGEIAPRGYLLRRHLTEQWVRFHSLPGSKRYAESLDEYAEIQHRHLLVASEIFSADEPLYVFRAHSDKHILRGKAKHQLVGRQFREAVAVVQSEGLGQDDEDRMYVRALVSKWKPDFFEAAIRQLADEEEVGVSFVSPSTKNIFCPYDGGMDVFTFSISPEELRARFVGWRSARPDGM